MMTNNKMAYAKCAYRDKYDEALIYVQFCQYKKSVNSTYVVHLKYDENTFCDDFAHLDIFPQDIVNKYVNDKNEISYHELNIDIYKIYGEYLYLNRIESVDFNKVSDENRKKIRTWNLKKGKDNQPATYKKKLVYYKIEFDDKDIDVLLPGDSDFIVDMSPSLYYQQDEVTEKNETVFISESNGDKFLSVKPLKRKINNVFVGLPEHLIHRIVWVAQKYRQNPLSWIPGGTTVVVEFHGHDVFGYDNIKKPSAYVEKFWEKEYTNSDIAYSALDEQAKIEFYRQKISRIYAQNNALTQDSFEEVWNCQTATILPWASLVSYDDKTL